jgi:hypothetical protein
MKGGDKAGTRAAGGGVSTTSTGLPRVGSGAGSAVSTPASSRSTTPTGGVLSDAAGGGTGLKRKPSILRKVTAAYNHDSDDSDDDAPAPLPTAAAGGDRKAGAGEGSGTPLVRAASHTAMRVGASASKAAAGEGGDKKAGLARIGSMAVTNRERAFHAALLRPSLPVPTPPDMTGAVDTTIRATGPAAARDAATGFRDPAIAAAAAVPLLDPAAGLRMPSEHLAATPTAPADAKRRNGGPAAPRLTSAKKRSQARAPGEAPPVIVFAGHVVAGPTGAAAAPGGGGGAGGGSTITVHTYSREALGVMGVYSLLETRNRLRELLGDVNEDLTTLLQAGDALIAERDKLKRVIAAGAALAGKGAPAHAAR